MAVMRGNRVDGNWLMKWDELKTIPMVHHRVVHRKRVTSELHDSYFRLMTIKHSISKIEWASNDYIIQLNDWIIQLWPKMHILWTRLHLQYAGPLNGHCYIIIVENFSKWSEIFKCRHPISTNTVNVLNELLGRFGIQKILVCDHGAQFTDRDFKDFCTSLFIDHIATAVSHPRSNGQAGRFVDTFKRAQRKN